MHHAPSTKHQGGREVGDTCFVEPRYCSNCRAEIPPREEVCPACGVFTGEMFNGKLPGRPRRFRWIFAFLAIAALAAAAGMLLLQRRGQPTELTQSVSVVTDRPGGSRRAQGAVVNEAEAIRLLRRHLVSTGIKNECVAISSQGVSGNEYRLTAVNSCERTRLGKFVVDGRSQEVRSGR